MRNRIRRTRKEGVGFESKPSLIITMELRYEEEQRVINEINRTTVEKIKTKITRFVFSAQRPGQQDTNSSKVEKISICVTLVSIIFTLITLLR